MTFTDMILDLLNDGYKMGAPGIIGATIDSQVCLESKCSKCGHSGMEYHPYSKPEVYSYRAFAVCPDCGDWEEF